MRTRLFVAVAVWIAGAAGGPLALEAKAAWGTNNQHKLVPAYFYPDWWNAGNAWYRMCDSMETAEGPSTAMMNPSSGPGSAANPDYQRVIDYCHGRGQRVIGYVHTSYGSRSATDVKADIDAMYAFYPAIDGIYLDEMSNSSSTRSYYRDLYVYVKGEGRCPRCRRGPRHRSLERLAAEHAGRRRAGGIRGDGGDIPAVVAAGVGQKARGEPVLPTRLRSVERVHDAAGLPALEVPQCRLHLCHRRRSAEPVGHAAAG